MRELVLLVCLLVSALSFAKDSDGNYSPMDQNLEKDTSQNTFTINFNNVSIIEYIRFVSKIANVNFVFEDADLPFTVTILSEEPTSAKNIMSILVQILRIHDLSLLEQENNLLITKSKEVTQIPTVVSNDLPESPPHRAPLITRVFRIKNANLNTVAGIIRPMMSVSAQIEVSNETRQLIVTDITTNVEKIGALLASIDSPHSPLDVESFVAKHVLLSELIELATEIIKPFAESNPLIFVPQLESNTIFIISTPYLIERTMTILSDLDTPSKGGIQAVSNQNVLLYRPMNRPRESVQQALKQIGDDLQTPGAPPSKLYNTLIHLKSIRDTNTLLFFGDSETLGKVKDILASLDVPMGPGEKTSFYIYKIQRAHEEQIEQSLKQMAKNLEQAEFPDQGLIDAIDSLRWIKESDSLVFTGTETALQHLAQLIPTFDVPPAHSKTTLSQIPATSRFLIYHPLYRNGAEIRDSIEEVRKNLQESGLADPAFLHALETVKWVPSTNSLIFTGDPTSIDQIQTMVKSMDSLTAGENKGKYTFFLYKLQHVQGDVIQSNLKKVSDNLSQTSLPNAALIQTVKDISWIKESNSLMITGPAEIVQEVKNLIAHFDVGGGAPTAKSSFYIYKPVNRKAAEIQASLNDIAEDLQVSGLIDPDLLMTIGSMRYVESTNSLLFTGSPDSLNKVKELIQRLDVTSEGNAIQQIGSLTFFIYKLQYVSATQLMSSLRNFGDELKKANTVDKDLVNVIDSMKWIKENNSILFTGPSTTLQKIEALVQKFDIASLAAQGPTTRGASSFVLYKPKYQTGDELISVLCDFEQNLINSGVTDQGLFDCINNLKWIDKTSSLLISGDPPSIKKVEELLVKFDIPSKEGAVPSIESIDNTNFLVYKLQYHQGTAIQTALKQIAGDLAKTSTGTSQALLQAINSLQWIEVTNSLLGTGEQETLTKLKELIQNLDVPLRQVFIEVLVIQTTLGNSQNFGLQWGGRLQYFNKVTSTMGNFPGSNPATGTTPPVPLLAPLSAINATTTPGSSSATQVPFINAFDFGVIGDLIMHKGKSFLSLGSLVNALQLDTDSTILLNPKIIAQDNNNSTIFFGQNVPYTASIVTNTSNNTLQSNSIEYINVGNSLSITPLIGNSDVVTLDISNNISSIAANITGMGNGGNNGIQTNQTTLSTRVHVPDKHFVVLTGQINETQTHFKSSIPCLGGLPVIGLAFSENDRNEGKNNIIIFLRPHIIHSFDEYKEETDHQECLFRGRTVLPLLKEEFDDGLDIVKTPEND